MTIDEHIHKAEEDAKMAEFDTKWGIGNYFIDRTEALEYAKECRQLAEWLKELKQSMVMDYGGAFRSIIAENICRDCSQKHGCHYRNLMSHRKVRNEWKDINL